MSAKGKPSIAQKDKINSHYIYTNRYAFLTKSDGNIGYISTNSFPTARNIKAGMTKAQMIEAYGDNFQLVTLANGENFEYLDENSKVKIAFIINDKDIIIQIDCKKYD